MRRELGLMVAVSALTLWACGGQTFTELGDAGGDGGSSSSSGSSSGGSSGGSSSGGSSGGSSSSSGGSSSSSGGSTSSSGGSSSSSGGSSSGVVPDHHRTDDGQCSQPAPAGNCNFGGSSGGGMCSSDTECTDGGVNGRCVESQGGVAFCGCTYDTCMHDTDCASGQACACHGSTYNSGGNTCMAGNCRVDTDCGAGGYCSPSYDPTGCGGLLGYFCHTAADLCVNDRDCATTGGPQVCWYTTATGRWECHPQLFCA